MVCSMGEKIIFKKMNKEKRKIKEKKEKNPLSSHYQRHYQRLVTFETFDQTDSKT